MKQFHNFNCAEPDMQLSDKGSNEGCSNLPGAAASIAPLELPLVIHICAPIY